MRLLLAALAIPLLASAAPAQDRPSFKGPAAFDAMRPVDAARLNRAAESDPRTRQALDEVEKRLNEGGHRAGAMLEKTRP